MHMPRKKRTMMKKQESPIPTNPLDKIMIEGQRAGIFRYQENVTIAEFLIENPEDTELQEILEEAIGEQKALDIIEPDPFRAQSPISVDILEGIIGLGFMLPDRIPWMIAPEMLCNHILICGRSGGGKTNLILLILYQLLEMKRNDQGF